MNRGGDAGLGSFIKPRPILPHQLLLTTPSSTLRWRKAHLLRRWRAQAELALRARALERSTLTRRMRRAFRAWRTEASVRLTLATLRDELECRTRGRLLRACMARWRAAAARAGLLRRVFGAALAARSRPEGAERIALDYNTLASCFLAWQAGLARARARRMEVAARYAADAFRWEGRGGAREREWPREGRADGLSEATFGVGMQFCLQRHQAPHLHPLMVRLDAGAGVCSLRRCCTGGG